MLSVRLDAIKNIKVFNKTGTMFVLYHHKYPCRQRLHHLTLCIYYVRTPLRPFSILNLLFSRQLNDIDHGAFRTLVTLLNFVIFRASIRETGIYTVSMPRTKTA